jgi:hypothetical protein
MAIGFDSWSKAKHPDLFRPLGSFQQQKLFILKMEGPGSSPGSEVGRRFSVVVARIMRTCFIQWCL